MAHKVHDVPLNKKVLKELPDLAKIFAPLKGELSDLEDVTEDQLIRYVCYAYDRKSPLAQESDVVEKKIQAMNLAGVKLSKDDKENSAWRIIFHLNPIAVSCKMQFCKYQNSLAWRQLMIKMDALDNVERAMTGDNQSKSKSPVEIAKVIAEVSEKMKPLERDILELSDKVFGGDVDMSDHLASFIEDSKNWVITPEDYIQHGASL